MSNYMRSNMGPGNIGALNPTIGYPQQPAGPQQNPYPAPPNMPQYPAMPAYPAYPAMPVYPTRSGLRGLMGLFGLGTDGTTPIWQRAWFPYAALAALGGAIYFVMRSRGGSLPEDVLFKNPSRGAPPDDAPGMVHATYNLMARSAGENGESARTVEWSKSGNTWMIGDAQGRFGHIVTKPNGDIWVAYHRTGHGDRKLKPQEAADMARDFFGGESSYTEDYA